MDSNGGKRPRKPRGSSCRPFQGNSLHTCTSEMEIIETACEAGIRTEGWHANSHALATTFPDAFRCVQWYHRCEQTLHRCGGSA